MVKLEIRDYVITARIWVIAIVCWFITTIGCTLYTTAKMSQFTSAIKTDHQLLLQLETANRNDVVNRDIEVRKRLIGLQDSLGKMQEQQTENMKRITELQKLLDRKRQ